MDSIHQRFPKLEYPTVFFIILLIFLTSIEANANATLFMLKGGSNSMLFDNDTHQEVSWQVIDEKRSGRLEGVMVGSRPPTCDWKKYCTRDYCGKCQAIQVPIILHYDPPTTSPDDISNYKPICWKCKCGRFTFNP